MSMKYKGITGHIKYFIKAVSANGTTKERTLANFSDLPVWVHNVEAWPTLTITTRGGKIKYRRVNGIVEEDNTDINLSTKRYLQ